MIGKNHVELHLGGSNKELFSNNKFITNLKD